MRIAAVLVLALAGCATEPRTDIAAPEERAGQTPRVYESKGTFLWSEPGRVYLNHEEIPGFMDAMAMGFDIRDQRIVAGIDPGASVEFRVVVEAETFYVDQILPIE